MHERTDLQDLIVLLQLLDHRGWVNTKYMPCMVLNKVDLTSFQLKTGKDEKWQVRSYWIIITYHTKKMCNKNIPIIIVKRWKQVLNYTIIYLITVTIDN